MANYAAGVKFFPLFARTDLSIVLGGASETYLASSRTFKMKLFHFWADLTQIFGYIMKISSEGLEAIRNLIFKTSSTT